MVGVHTSVEVNALLGRDQRNHVFVQLCELLCKFGLRDHVGVMDDSRHGKLHGGGKGCAGWSR
jgi:hypothetical protein